ncbi:MAG TPA: fibronectin type III domain-containing protein [Chitinophagales bacterium]|nr:fibronectin type III domain-containing protein [Chitinophagales bacterium]
MKEISAHCSHSNKKTRPFTFPFIPALSFCLFVIFIFPAEVFAQCNTPVGVTTDNITPTSANSYFSCFNCTGIMYIEYGLSGFTPGTGASAGAGGTVAIIPNGYGYYTYSGLTPNTSYDFYFRQNCSGVFSPNSAVQSFTTAVDCSTATVVNCNTLNSASFAGGSGVWQLCTYGYSKEKIFSFTPVVSGNHMLFIPKTISPENYITSVSYKAPSGGCTTYGWTCIGNNTAWEPSQFSFGPLTAGTQYYFLADGLTTSAFTGSFRIECPYCAQATNVTVTDITPVSASVSWSGGYGVLEYGPAGFTPGTGTTAGVNGTLVFASGSYALEGLSPTTAYDIYVRIYCSGNNYSPNSMRVGFATADCPLVVNYGVLGSTIQLYFSGPGYWDNTPYCVAYTPGQEIILKFIAPSSGYYIASVGYSASPFGYGYKFIYREAGTTCDMNGYNCLAPYQSAWGTPDLFLCGPFTAGATYDFFCDAGDESYGGSDNTLSVTFSCPSPANISATNISPASFTVNWECNCPSTTYLEYGPAGFTPGTGATAGANGTLLNNVTSPITIGGLTALTYYDVYLRTSCGGNFSLNTPVLHVRTALDCSTVSSVNCGDNITFNSTTNTIGSWTNYGCLGTDNDAREVMYKFTPAQSASHQLILYNDSYSGCYPVTYYYKAASGSCDETGWTCIGSMCASPDTISFGPLMAGTSYNIMMDGPVGIYTTFTQYLTLSCPECIVCPKPANLSTSNITTTKAKLNWNTNDCAVGYRIQYKQSAGTWITKNVSSNIGYKTIKGLLANTSYVWKVKTKCSTNPVVYSAWSSSVSFNTTMKLAEMEEKEEAPLNIFPNPTSGNMSIQTDPATAIRVVIIQNFIGQVLLQKDFPEDANSEATMDVSTLPEGGYLLTAFTGEGKIVKMFVKQ